MYCGDEGDIPLGDWDFSHLPFEFQYSYLAQKSPTARSKNQIIQTQVLEWVYVRLRTPLLARLSHSTCPIFARSVINHSGADWVWVVVSALLLVREGGTRQKVERFRAQQQSGNAFFCKGKIWIRDMQLKN